MMKTVLTWGCLVGLVAMVCTGRATTNTEALLLPPVETIVERSWARAQKEPENDRAFNAAYGYTRTKVTEFKNVRGYLTKRKEKITINDPAASNAGGITNFVEGSPWATNRVSSDVSSHKRELLSDTNLVRRYACVLKGRELMDGRPVFVVDFKPANRKSSGSTLKDRFLNKAAGRLWVDEEDYALVKADVHLTEGVSVFGGLVAAVHKFNLSFERERTEDGLWFTQSVIWHLEVREVIVDRIVDSVETRTDVRRVR